MFIAVGVVVLAAAVKLGLSGYQLQVSGIKGQVIEIRFDRTDKVRYDEMVKLLRDAGDYKADTAAIVINHVPDLQRAEEIMDYFCLDTLYDACASTWEKTLATGKFVAANIPHDNQKEYPEYVNAIGLWEYTKTVAPAFNCRLHSILTYELLTAAGIKARYITCLPYDRNAEPAVVEAPIAVDGNKMTIKISEEYPGLKDVDMYTFQDQDNTQMHMYMPTYSFINFFGNMQVIMMSQLDMIDTTDAAAVKAIYDSIDDAVETINVSFVMTKATKAL